MDKVRAIAGVDLSACGRIGKHAARCYLSTQFKPIAWDEDITKRDDIFLCIGYVCLRFTRSKFPNVRQRFQIISHDSYLYPISKIRLHDWRDFLTHCKTDPRFEWVRRACRISERTFDIAAQNYGVYVQIGPDFEKYIDECGGATRFTTEAVLLKAADDAKRLRKEKKRKQGEEPDDADSDIPDMEER